MAMQATAGLPRSMSSAAAALPRSMGILSSVGHSSSSTPLASRAKLAESSEEAQQGTRGLLLGFVLGCSSALLSTRRVRSAIRRTATSRRWTSQRLSYKADCGLCHELTLTQAEKDRLRDGLSVQKQERDGRNGVGLFVTEVQAPPALVLERLKSFEEYPDMIPVVREASIRGHAGRQGRHPDDVLVDYKVSRFWLSVSVMHGVDEDAGVVRFDLDPTATGGVLKEASGYWRVEPSPTGNPGSCRVWLCVQLSACRLLPSFLVDYAAERALRRATNWLRPHMEGLWRSRVQTLENAESQRYARASQRGTRMAVA